MSQKTQLSFDMMKMVANLKGGHLTRMAREITVGLFVKFVMSAGFTHIHSVRDIGGRHFRLFIARRLEEGKEQRSVANNASHLRGILKEAKCFGVLNAKELTNAQLGIAGASRAGTNVPMADEDYHRFRARAFALGRPGFAALLHLERCFGLRGNEGLHAREDVLERWLQEIEQDGAIGVFEGVKGGRPRIVPITDKAEAITAVTEALAIARKQGGFLIVRANGKASGGLKQARSIYHGWAHRAGLKPHALRYAFAHSLFRELVAAGFSEREASTITGIRLGHGDGRGRWANSAYRLPVTNKHLAKEMRHESNALSAWEVVSPGPS